MMYILTQEEMDSLKQEQASKIRLSEKKLQALCTKICDTMPVVWGWGGPDPKPWGCIYSIEHDEEWYCDKCPVQEICPSVDREYSK